jgi:DNA-binding transcriptional LysR family regulator
MELNEASEELIDSRKLRVFMAVGRSESYTEAARVLQTVQSAISHSIHDLERELGCGLLRKAGRKMRLTDAGLVLFDHGLRIERTMAETRRALFRSEQRNHPKYSIGTCHSIEHFFLPQVTGKLFKEFPDCTFNVFTRSAKEITKAIRQRRVDIGFSLRPSVMEQLEFQTLFRDSLCFLISPQRPSITAASLSEIESGHHRFAMFAKKSDGNQLVESCLQSCGITPRSIAYFESMAAIKSFAMLGHGIAVLPEWFVLKELERSELINLSYGEPLLRRDWGILIPQGKSMEGVDKAFFERCKDVTRLKKIEGWPIETWPSDSN